MPLGIGPTQTPAQLGGIDMDQPNFGLLDTQVAERIPRNMLAMAQAREQMDMNRLNMQNQQEDRMMRNALARDRMGVERQEIGLKLMPQIAQLLYADPSDGNIDALSSAYSQATGQDVSQFAVQLKQMPPEQRRQVALGLGQKYDPKFQVLNQGDRFQAVQVGPGGMTPVGESLPITKVQREAQSSPYYTPVYTSEGVASFNARTGQAEPLSINGRRAVKSTDDPVLQGTISREKESGKTIGEAATKSAIELPRSIDLADETIRLVDELISHPGRQTATGASRLAQVQRIPGTDAKDFDVRLEQLKGKQFLQAFESLKGGGQITEVEGAKATNALSRMNPDSSDEEFVAAAKEFQDIVKKGLVRAKNKAEGSMQHVAPKGAAFGGINPETKQMEYFDAQGNKL